MVYHISFLARTLYPLACEHHPSIQTENLLPLGSASLHLSTQQLRTREALRRSRGPTKLFFFFPTAAVCSSGHHGRLKGTGDGHGPATRCNAAVESPVPALRVLGHLHVTIAWCNTSLGHGSRVATMGWHCAGDKQPGFSSGAASFSTSLRDPVPLHHTGSPLGHSSHVLAPDGPAGAHTSLLFLFQGFLGDPGPVGEKGEKGAKVRVSVLALHSPAWVGQGVAPSLPQPPSPRSCSPPSLRLLLAFPGGERRKWPARSCWASCELTGKPGVSLPCWDRFFPPSPFPGRPLCFSAMAPSSIPGSSPRSPGFGQSPRGLCVFPDPPARDGTKASATSGWAPR